MKVVVIGGTGLIGSNVVINLRRRGHDVTAASPRSGVNTVTGEGLINALTGAQVVIDVANSPSFEDRAVMDFFVTAGRNLLDAELATGVGHHVALSIVGTDRNPDSGYLRAKLAQENLITTSGVPYTILRSTQFFEFIGAIAESSVSGQLLRVSSGAAQPVAAKEVAAALSDIASRRPANGILEIAGPERLGLDEFVRRFLRASHDTREVVSDPSAPYFGAVLNDRSITPDEDALIGKTRFADWLHASLSAHSADAAPSSAS